jgi:tRNA(fMet)-specific endonuclease VapC
MSRHDVALLDTGTVLLLPRLNAAALPARPRISTITLAELAAGPLSTEDIAERSARSAEVQQAEADFDPVPFDAAAARAFGLVSGDLRRAGRKRAARALDALIAATAIANGLPLYTCNPSDFEGIDGLELVPVAHPGA